MIIIKHACEPGPKRWKFRCGCGCEWIADETEVDRVYRCHDVCAHNVMHHHAISCCPECGCNAGDERTVDADEYENMLTQTDPSALIRYVNYVNIDQTEEEKPF